MKKIMIVALAALLALSLIACGSSTQTPENSQTAGQSGNAPFSWEDNTPSAADPTGGAVDLASILSGQSVTNWTKVDAATKQQIIDSAKVSGYDVSFEADGSMVIKGEGTNMKQNPDGTWTLISDDGSSSQLGGKWPDNQYTKLLPVPPFEIMAAVTDEDGFSVIFSGSVQLSLFKDYLAKVKAKGFTQNAEENEDANAYEYFASNGDYEIELGFGAGTVSLNVRPANKD